MSALSVAVRKDFLRASLPLWKNLLPIRNKYIVLLPEIPDDTPENNPLLKLTPNPEFSKLSTEKCINAIGKLCIDYESGICRIEDDLQEKEGKKDFQAVFDPLEKLAVPLQFAYSTIKNYYANKNNKDISSAGYKLHSRVKKAWMRKFQSIPIYNAVKEIKSDKIKLTEPMKRVVDKYLLEARLNGLELSGYNLGHFENSCIKLEEYKEKYRKKLESSMKRFSYTISNESLIRAFPDELVRMMAKDITNPFSGPWTVTLDPEIYNSFLKHCPDRDMRWNVWNAYNTRASSLDRDFNASIDIEEIRFNRHDQAKLLGYNSFAEMSMETKMAESVENVLSMIVTLHVKSKSKVEEELDALQDFAASNGFKGDLKLWDIPYWQQKQKETLFSVDDFLLKQYFPYPTVLKGLFNFCEKLFGIIIKDTTKDAETWHEDVSFYKIYNENDVHIASFYMDPYYRPQEKLYGSRIELCMNKSDIVRSKPLAYLTFNFQRPILNTPSLLSPSDVLNLLKKFGHLLQHSITSSPYSEVAGLANLEWDTIDVCSHFMTYWFYHYKTASSLSGHVETGEPLPAEMHDKLKGAWRHMAAYNLAIQLYLAALDLELHTKRDFWMDVMKKVWADYMPFELEKNNFHPCSFSSIFSGSFPASYYSFKWSEMIAMDIFSVFKEVGLDNEDAIKEIGKRFSATYLALGGSCYASEVFRRFIGRDPSPDAFLAAYKLKEKSEHDS